MRRLATLSSWSLFFILFPVAALAADAGGEHAWGYAIGAGLAVGLAGLGCGIG